MQYRSINDMNNLIKSNLSKFIMINADLIVGVPRSGMLPANLVALYLNKPFTDLDSFAEERIYSCGNRVKNQIKEIKNVLVIDDSIGLGAQIKITKNKLKHLENKYNFIHAAIFARSQSKHLVNIYCEVVDGPRIFEWNMFHHDFIETACVDIDGVICENPVIDDDGPEYIKQITFAKPLYIPSRKIKTLITCRLEKYRKITEDWLSLFDIKYDKLIMLNLPNKEARIKWGKHGEYKANEYKKPYYNFFIESSLAEAKIIKCITNKPVFCIETMSLL